MAIINGQKVLTVVKTEAIVADEASEVSYSGAVEGATNVKEALDLLGNTKADKSAIDEIASDIYYFNEVYNDNFSSGTIEPFNLQGVNTTTNVSEGALTCVVASAYGGIRYQKELKANHKYFLSVGIVDITDNAGVILFSNYGGVSGTQTFYSLGNAQIIFETSSTTGYWYIQNNNACSFTIKDISLIDLTEIYGANNEPTIDEFSIIYETIGYTNKFKQTSLTTSTTNEEDINRLFEYYDITLNEEYEEGYIHYTSGNFASASSYRATNFIPLVATKIKMPILFKDGAGIAFYDSNKRYISGYGNIGNLPNNTEVELEVPTNACYIRMSALKNEISSIYLKVLKIGDAINKSVSLFEMKSSNPCNYKGNSIRVFNKILCIGDSLTHGTFDYYEGETLKYLVNENLSYPTYLKALTGRETKNFGKGGYSSKQWYEEHANIDLSGYDCAIIELGLNDYAGGSPITLTESNEALRNIITKLKSENNGIKIFVSTILPCFQSTNAVNYNAIVKNICEELDGVYMLDIYNYGNTINVEGYRMGHLTALGYQRLAQDYHNYISYIIDNNLADFAYIQFIGTEYTY